MVDFFSCRRSAYFKVNTPSQSTAWINGQTNLLQWTKGLLDGINAMDIELARLSADGVWMIAANGAYHVLRSCLTTAYIFRANLRSRSTREFRQTGHRIAKSPASRRLLPAFPQLDARGDVWLVATVLHPRCWVDAHERHLPIARVWRAHNHTIEHTRPQLAVRNGLPSDREWRTWVAHSGRCWRAPPASCADLSSLRALDIDAVVFGRHGVCVCI